MGSLLFLAQERITQILSRAKGPKGTRKTQGSLNQNKSLGKKQGNLTNVNMINKFTTSMIVTCQRQEIFHGGRWKRFIHNHIHKT